MNAEPKYLDRKAAGLTLAPLLAKYASEPGVLVLALPRGGVPVAFEVARELHCELDVLVVRKLGTPGQEELAMGAIASGGVRLLNTGILRDCCVTATEVEVTTRREEAELKRREDAYRRGRPPLSVSGRTVLVVDDGLATGTTVRAAIKALRGMGAKRLVVAVPVGASDTCRDVAREVDELVCPLRPPNLVAISLWYLNFSQTTDTEVRELLERGASNFAASETIRGEDASRHAG